MAELNNGSAIFVLESFTQFATPSSDQYERLVSPECTQPATQPCKGAKSRWSTPPGPWVLYQTTATRSICLTRMRQLFPAPLQRRQVAASLRGPVAAPAS